MKKRFIVEEDMNKSIIFKNEIKKELNPVDFIIPHRTYIVNMNYIRTFNDKFLFLENEEKIKISRLKK